jgi:tetratricopeptide (TPR) repeat protein
MARRAFTILAVGAGLLRPVPALGQNVWVAHQPPCELSTSHYLIKGAIVHLKFAVESSFVDERDQQVQDAIDVLRQAILEKGQADNAASWYYLGRAYAIRKDLAGADSAFHRALALAPDCAQDVRQHARRLAAFALNDALRTWGTDARDSALAFFHAAHALDSANAEIPLYMSVMFASETEPDSAERYLEFGMAAAQTDTAHGARLKQAQLETARAFETRAYTNAPAIQTASQTRLLRDSTTAKVEADSALLNKIVSQVVEIRTAGQRLNASSLAAFQRDSTTLETRLATSRRALDSLRQTATTDSVAVAGAVAPVIRAYRRYVEHYPEDADAAIQLVRVYAADGDRNALDQLVTQVAASPYPTGSKLTQAGLSLYNDGLIASAARLLESALRREPNDHAALGIITHVYYAQARADTLMAIAHRRLSLEPLDPAAARAMAYAWDLRGNKDSTRRWIAEADTGLAWNVRIIQFSGGDQSTSLTGTVTNVAGRPLPAMTLLFEFLDKDGAVAFSSTVPVPALDPKGREPISIRVDQSGALSWRYRRT